MSRGPLACLLLTSALSAVAGQVRPRGVEVLRIANSTLALPVAPVYYLFASAVFAMVVCFWRTNTHLLGGLH